MTNDIIEFELKPMAIVNEKITEIEKIVAEFVAKDLKLEIETDEEMKNITDLLKESKSMAKLIESRRQEYVSPAHEYKKQVDGLFKARQAPLTEFEAKIKQAMNNYHAKKELEAKLLREAEEKKRKEEEDRLRKIREKKEEEERLALEKIKNAKNAKEKAEAEKLAKKLEDEKIKAQVNEETSKMNVSMVAPAKTSIRGNSGLASFRKSWAFDIEDEFKIPRKFLKVDESAIKNAIKEGLREIDGVKIYQKTGVAIR